MTAAQDHTDLPAPRARGWLGRAEVGTVWAIRFVAFMATAIGRGPAHVLLRFIALWYTLTYGAAKRASRAYLERYFGKATFGMVYRHIHTFAAVTLDRVLFVAGRYRGLDVRTNGNEHLDALHAEGKGAILLGAHVGSFEAMRAVGDRDGLRVHSVGYFRNAERINAILDRLNPQANARLIHLGDDPTGSMLRIKDALDRGEMVAFLGDRALPGSRTTTVRFLGGEAEIPLGVFSVAAALRCPVYLVFGLYHPPRRYELYCEPFAERIEAPRGRREEALREYAQQYASAVERYVRKAPYNWFNFYDFWRPR
jgi:predicted LPLAT superfamily acyltransferase